MIGSYVKGLGTLGKVGLAANVYGAQADARAQSKGYIAKQREKRLGGIAPGGVPKMQKISARHALMSFLHATMEKDAAELDVNKLKGFPFTKALGAVPGALLLGAGVAGGGLMAARAGKGISGVFQKFQAKRMYEELQRRYPEIKRHPKAREYFDLIVAYAPSLMRHPAAIGDFLRRQLEYPMSSVEFIKQLADLEGVVAKTEGSSPAARFAQDMVSAGGGMINPMAERSYQTSYGK